MEIGLVYSREDPRQTQVRDFVHMYIRDRGILAHVVEWEQSVTSPEIIINGCTLKDLRSEPRDKQASMYPAIADVARALEQSAWSV